MHSNETSLTEILHGTNNYLIIKHCTKKNCNFLKINGHSYLRNERVSVPFVPKAIEPATLENNRIKTLGEPLLY